MRNMAFAMDRFVCPLTFDTVKDSNVTKAARGKSEGQ
jgi:hypothetical protein